MRRQPYITILSTCHRTRGGYRVGSGPSVTRGDFYKLDLNGNTIWHIEVPYVLNQSAGAGNWFFASPTVAPDLGIVILRNGLRLTHAFNMTDGKAIWTRDGRYNIGTPVQFGGPPLTDAAIYKYGQLYMNDYYGIVCLNARDGSEVWYTYTSREMNTQGFSYSFNRLYVVNEQGFLFVLDATTGEKLSGYDGWGSLQLHSAPVPYDGKLYVGAPDWNMYCFKEAAPAPEQTPTPTAEPLTADIIAQKVLNSLPAYPAVPSASEIAQLIASSLPSGVSADEVAQKVVANLPSNPTASQIAQEISNQLSAKPASVPQEYSIATIVITIAVIAALAIGFVNLYLIKKRE